MNIGENIKKLRINKGLEQKDLAEMLGISNRTVSAWEHGKATPKMGMIEKMSVIFDCGKLEIIDGEEAKNQSQAKRLLTYVEMLSKLSEENQNIVIKYIEFLTKEESKNETV